MSSKKVEQVKQAAIAHGLHRATSLSLWNAQKACEEADKDNFKNFQREVDKARKHLDEAVELYEEQRK